MIPFHFVFLTLNQKKHKADIFLNFEPNKTINNNTKMKSFEANIGILKEKKKYKLQKPCS
ncbi:hypothetical protein Hanom_Chr10g00889501 [Helianthus anomalus]